MATLEDCLATAAEYWEEVTPDSARIQEIRATICVEILGRDKAVGKIGTREAQKLLQALNSRGLARKTVADYYSTFKRMLALNDQLPDKGYARWPRPPSPPRNAVSQSLPTPSPRWLRDLCNVTSVRRQTWPHSLTLSAAVCSEKFSGAEISSIGLAMVRFLSSSPGREAMSARSLSLARTPGPSSEIGGGITLFWPSLTRRTSGGGIPFAANSE
jgi:hypothetical protein